MRIEDEKLSLIIKMSTSLLVKVAGNSLLGRAQGADRA